MGSNLAGDDEDEVSGIKFRPAAPAKGANIARRRSVLGRGLSALMSSSAVQVDAVAKAPSLIDSLTGPGVQPVESAPLLAEQRPFQSADEREGGLVYLPIDRIHANKSQPRQSFPEVEIEGLAKSIADSGMLQPIIVRREKSASSSLANYEIVAGERRFRAAKKAGLVSVPALIKQLDDREALQLAIVENVQRSNLNPVEEAKAYQRLIDEFNASQQEVADSVGKDRASVANALRLLKLPPGIQELLVDGKITAGHGRALLSVTDPNALLALARKIVAEGLSVREAEQLASAQSTKKPKLKVISRPERSPAEQELEERLRRALGTKVHLSLNGHGGGEVRIAFYSQVELESLLEKLKA